MGEKKIKNGFEVQKASDYDKDDGVTHAKSKRSMSGDLVLLLRIDELLKTFEVTRA